MDLMLILVIVLVTVISVIAFAPIIILAYCFYTFIRDETHEEYEGDFW